MKKNDFWSGFWLICAFVVPIVVCVVGAGFDMNSAANVFLTISSCIVCFVMFYLYVTGKIEDKGEDIGFDVSIIKKIMWISIGILLLLSTCTAKPGNDIKDIFNKDPNKWTESEKSTVDSFMRWLDKNN